MSAGPVGVGAMASLAFLLTKSHVLAKIELLCFGMGRSSGVDGDMAGLGVALLRDAATLVAGLLFFSAWPHVSQFLKPVAAEVPSGRSKSPPTERAGHGQAQACKPKSVAMSTTASRSTTASGSVSASPACSRRGSEDGEDVVAEQPQWPFSGHAEPGHVAQRAEVQQDRVIEVIQRQRKPGPRSAGKYTGRVLVGVEEDTGFQVARRLIGRGGCNMKAIVAVAPGTKIRIRGRGSKYLEGPAQKESEEPLMLCVSSPSKQEFALAMLRVKELVERVRTDYNEFKIRRGV